MTKITISITTGTGKNKIEKTKEITLEKCKDTRLKELAQSLLLEDSSRTFANMKYVVKSTLDYADKTPIRSLDELMEFIGVDKYILREDEELSDRLGLGTHLYISNLMKETKVVAPVDESHFMRSEEELGLVSLEDGSTRIISVFRYDLHDYTNKQVDEVQAFLQNEDKEIV